MRALKLILALTLATACVDATARVRQPPTPGFRPAATDEDEVEALILDQTNAFRAAAGRGQLTENETLSSAARAFAVYMARTGRFSHTADGRTPADRAAAAGYDYCNFAENIAFEQGGAGFTAEQLAGLLVDGWKGSPGHRRNLLDPDVTEIGVGVARAPRGEPRYLAVQVFGRPASLRFSFKITNLSPSAVGYLYDGDRRMIPARSTITHTACEPGSLTFDPGVMGPGANGRGGLTPSAGTVYRLRAGVRGGVMLEVDRNARRPGPGGAS